MLDHPKIIQNAVYVPEYDRFYKSSYRHDHVVIQFDDGREYFIDGGNDYFRYTADAELEKRIVRYTLTTDDSLYTIVNNLLWGTRGKNGDGPLHYVRLVECETDHLEAILKKYEGIINPIHDMVIKLILNERGAFAKVF